MKLCKNCIKLLEVCTIYGKAPPSNGFAEKCRHYQQKAVIEIVVEPEKQKCDTCGHNNDGWCLRFDHPDFEYNFVKIKDNTVCPRN